MSMSGGIRRTKSQQGRRTPPQVIYQRPPPQVFQQQQLQPLPQPVIINKIYNDRDDDDDYRHSLAPVHPQHHHSRTSSFNAPAPRDPRDDWELEKTRKELAAYKLEKDKAAEKKRLEKEIEFERLRKEKEEEEEEEKLKAERKKAIEKYKIDEAEKVAKAKKEKAEREEEYQRRLAEDLRKNGVVLGKDKQVQSDANRPTYTRMSRKHLSIETLNKFKIDFEFDHVSFSPLPSPQNAILGIRQMLISAQDPDYVLIKRWVPEYEQDFLWSHTREARERRVTLLTIEAKDKHDHHRKHSHSHGRDEVEFEFVRKTKRERKPSPSPLLNFLAGGKRS